MSKEGDPNQTRCNARNGSIQFGRSLYISEQGVEGGIVGDEAIERAIQSDTKLRKRSKGYMESSWRAKAGE